MRNTEKHDPTCNECFLYASCGGVEGALGVASCLTLDPAECKKRGWVSFRDPMDFTFRWSETMGFNTPFRGKMSVPSAGSMPLYAPAIYHGGRRSRRLHFPWVAIPLYTIIRPRRDRTFGCIVKDGPALRHAFGLADESRIIVTSVAPDAYLERLWRHHQEISLADLLRSLNVQAVTVPNFSYFLDAPPVHTLYNRARMLRIAERFSSAGLPVVPHLNAFMEAHWCFWTAFLREQSNVVYVCKEFQTGFRAAAAGGDAYDRLVRLQDEVGRDLHPILIAGRRFLPKLRKDFETFTVVDGTPFIKTYHRQFLKSADDIGFNWKLRRTRHGQPLDDRLCENVTAYETRLREKADGPKAVQREFPLSGFMPPRPKEFPQQEPIAGLDLFKWKTPPENGCEMEPEPPLESCLQSPSHTGFARTRSVDFCAEIHGRLPVPK